jgi:hypothetical protein
VALIYFCYMSCSYNTPSPPLHSSERESSHSKENQLTEMHYSLILASLLAPLCIHAQGPPVQVNLYVSLLTLGVNFQSRIPRPTCLFFPSSYSDENCQDYIGSEYGEYYGIGPTGGPAGSFSALYVTLPTCSDTSGIHICFILRVLGV